MRTIIQGDLPSPLLKNTRVNHTNNNQTRHNQRHCNKRNQKHTTPTRWKLSSYDPILAFKISPSADQQDKDRDAQERGT